MASVELVEQPSLIFSTTAVWPSDWLVKLIFVAQEKLIVEETRRKIMKNAPL